MNSELWENPLLSFEVRLKIAVGELQSLRRWRSTHGPRLTALEGLLVIAQAEAAKGREAVLSLASEREANAALTEEVEALRARLSPPLKITIVGNSDGEELSPAEQRQAGRPFCPNCYTFGHDHSKSCKHRGKGTSLHVSLTGAKR